MIEGVGPQNGLGTCNGHPYGITLGCGGGFGCFKIGTSYYSINNGAVDSYTDCSSCDYYVKQVGINEFENELSISVYPNPVDSKVFIEQQKEIKPTQIEIRSITGKLIKTIELSEKLTEVKTQDWVSGTYFLTVRSNSKFYTKKLVVIH